ncbi:hypothetical protein CF68_18145 [Cupriavidus sp. SK-4]|jgi:hypothetical protein|nr:hypothetical protein CF68_18145 [Cupriavidus sp. SK-4]
MPGSGEAIDGAMQQAPQPARQERSDRQLMTMVQDGRPPGGQHKEDIVPEGPLPSCKKRKTQ